MHGINRFRTTCKGIYRFRTADRQADWGSGSYIGDLEGTVYYSSPLLGEYISRKNYMYIQVVHFARFTYLDEQNSKFFFMDEYYRLQEKQTTLYFYLGIINMRIRKTKMINLFY